MLLGCPAPEGDGTDTAPRTSSSPAPAQADAKVAPPVTVWADPLLKPLLTGIGDKFSEHYPGGYSVEYLETSELLATFSDGAPAMLPGVFLFCGNELLRSLSEAGLANETTARVFAGDSLALVQQAGEGFATPSLFDIYTLRFKSLVIAPEGTTSGLYARQALIADNVMPRVEDRLAVAEDTLDLLEMVATGEMLLGITPVSAIAGFSGIEVVMLIGEDLHKDIQYSAVASATESPGQLELLMFLSEDEAIQELVPGYGFTDMETALVED